MRQQGNRPVKDENKDNTKYQQDKKQLLILGSGFAGIEVLKKVQNEFKKNEDIEITLVSKDNFLLFTPMLPEVACGMIETRHIVTPVREFCKKAKFYEAKVESIDLSNKQVILTHSIGSLSKPSDWNQHVLNYDHLVIALGSENNFFGLSNVQQHAFTMTNIGDAIIFEKSYYKYLRAS